MARARLIQPGLTKNEVLAELGQSAQILFAMLPCFADREGRLSDRPKRLKAEIFPYYDADVDALLDALATCTERFITRYEIDGSPFIQITNFAVHQKPHHMEIESTIYPHCVDEPSTARPPNKDKDKDKDKDKVVLPPILDSPEFRSALDSWVAYRGSAYKPRGLSSLLSQAAKRAEEFGLPAVLNAFEVAMGNGWAGWNQDGSFRQEASSKPRKLTPL